MQKFDLLNSDLSSSALIEASAGTGKTFGITYLVLRQILGDKVAPLPLSKILVVTFTKAAAAELKERIASLLKNALLALTNPSELEQSERTLKTLLHSLLKAGRGKECELLLKHALSELNRAPICTLDAFGIEILTQRFVLSARALFENAVQPSVHEQQQEALFECWRKVLYSCPPEQLAELLQSYGSADPTTDFLERSQLANLMPKVRSLSSPTAEPAEACNEYRLHILPPAELKAQLKELSEQQDKLTERLEEESHKEEDLLTEFKLKLCEYKSLCDPKGAGEGYVSFDEEQNPILSGELYGRKSFLAEVKKFFKELWALNPDTATAQAYPRNDKAQTALSSHQALARLNGSYEEKLPHSAAKLKAFEDRLGEIFSFSKRHSWLNQEQVKLRAELEQLEVKLAKTQQTLTLFKQAQFAATVLRETERLCRREHKSSFAMTLHAFAEALQGEKSEALVRALREAFPVAFIDEFQDTDPLQYAIFKRLYLEDFSYHNAARCFFIGDPKQAIYGFRNADLNSYLMAKAQLPEEQIFTQKENFRSSLSVGAAVNALFSGELCGKKAENSAPSFFGPQVGFEKLDYQDGKQQLTFKPPLDAELSATSARTYVTKTCCDKGSKSALLPHYAAVCAQVIAVTLSEGRLDGNPLSPSDLAVLVRSKEQAHKIREELLKLKIPAVFYAEQEEVLATPEYERMLYLAFAMLEPRPVKIRRLLTCGLVNDLDLKGLLLDPEGEQEERAQILLGAESELLQSCRVLWEEHGFAPALEQYFKQHQLLAEILERPDGQQELTNYYHLAEILQQAHLHFGDLREQLRWFTELKAGRSDLFSGSEKIKRLPTDAEVVKILTYHGAKGLEFPLVFLPYTYMSIPKPLNLDEPFVFFGKPQPEESGQLWLNLNSFEDNVRMQQLSAPEEPQAARAEVEKLYDTAYLDKYRDELNMLYVALTRATTANFLFINQLITPNNNAQQISPLMWLLGHELKLHGRYEKLHGRYEKLQANEVLERLSSHPDFCCVEETLWRKLTPAIAQPLNPPSTVESGTLSVFNPQLLNRRFTLTSYSGIVRGLHEQEDFGKIEEEHGESESNELATEPLTAGSGSKPLCCPDFPRGRVGGNFMHLLLEHCDFSQADSPAYLNELCLQELRADHSGILREWYMNMQANPASDKVQAEDFPALAAAKLCDWLKIITHAPLLKRQNANFALCRLAAGSYLPELEFMLSCPHSSLQDFDERVRLPYLKEKLKAKRSELTALQPKILEGFVHGYIDLVFCPKAQDGVSRYYLLDYKNSYLGADLLCYSQDALRHDFIKSHYEVQDLLYALVLHRYLRNSLENYQFERDFGGVLYVYLRGLSPEGESGIFAPEISEHTLNTLDALFKQEN